MTFRRPPERFDQTRWTRRTAAGLLALSACSEAPTANHDVEDGSTARSDASTVRPQVPQMPSKPDGAVLAVDAGVSRDAEQLAALQPDNVSASNFARRVLYSWTTPEQASQLRATPTLLTRSQRSDGTRTNVSEALLSLAADDDALAAVLSEPRFQKGRFGWPSAWATLRGWPGESYGGSLIRIVLKPDAWVARLQDNRLSVVDLQNQPVSLDRALQTPERIAAVFFVNAQLSRGAQLCGTFDSCAPSAYREYFINNEAMIEEWSLATDAVLAEIDRGRAVVDKLLRVANRFSFIDVCWFSGDALCVWQEDGTGLPPYLSTAYYSALALASEYYAPSLENLTALSMALDSARFTPDPFVHRP